MTDRHFTRRLLALDGAAVAATYAVAGVAAYGVTLTMFFVNDDFYFLKIVAEARSPLVVFTPLLERFVRPAMVALYYVSYHTAGLSPWLYHVFALVPHLVTSWFLFLIAARLVPNGRLWAFLAGGLFLVFGGHSEAVAWPAGNADVLCAAGLTGAFLCYLRTIEPGASARWLGGFFTGVLFAALSKELWVVFPAILLAHAALFGLPEGTRRRAAIAIAVTIAAVVAYLAMRSIVFGTVTGGYSVLSSTAGGSMGARQARAFLLKCFLPSGSLAANLWLSGRDMLLWAAVAIVTALSARGHTARVLIFAGAATIAALLPVLPLSISVSTTESERYVYLPTVFSCLFVVWALKAVLRFQALAVAACVLLIGAHAAVLVKNNLRWRAAGALAGTVTADFVTEVARHDDGHRPEVFILNLADNVAGAYVFRTGFVPAFQIMQPEAFSRLGGFARVSAIYQRTGDDAATLTRVSDRAFRIDFGENTITQPAIPSTFHYRIHDQTPRSYRVEFTDAIRRAIVLYQTAGRLRTAGVVEGPGAPFGSVDLPTDPARCDGAQIRFAGWALARGGVRRVTLEEVAPDGVRPIGIAIERPGMRPDVEEAFSAYPGTRHAGWDFELPCDAVKAAPSGTMRVRVSAETQAGAASVIGERLVGVR